MVINEFESWKSSGDWIELYSFEDIDISGWIIRDNADSAVKRIPDGTSIGPSTNQFFVVEVGNRLNRDNDIIKLLKQDDFTIIDQIKYGIVGEVCMPLENETVGRYPDSNSTVERFKIATRGFTNNDSEFDSCPTPSPIPTVTATMTPTLTLTPTPKPTVTIKPTSTPKPTYTQTPTVTQKPTASPVKVRNSTPTRTILNGEDVLSDESISKDGTGFEMGIKNMLADSITSGDKEELTPRVLADKTGKKFPLIAGLLIIAGTIFLGISFYPIIKSIKKSYNSRNE